MGDLHGDSPVYLALQLEDGPLIIDLDEHGWKSKYAHIFRSPARWDLIAKKTDTPVLSMVVLKGEQSYYTAKVHVFPYRPGLPGDPQGLRLRAYGIGKKRVDGNQDQLWWMPWGEVTVGADPSLLMIAYANKAHPFARMDLSP